MNTTPLQGSAGICQAWMGIWAGSLHFLQAKLCVWVYCITICLPVYYIRIGLEASENELACCHLLKSFRIIREFQLPLLSQCSSFYAASWLHAIFILWRRTDAFIPCPSPGLVISMYFSPKKSHWVIVAFLNCFCLGRCCTELACSEISSPSWAVFSDEQLKTPPSQVLWVWVFFIHQTSYVRQRRRKTSR